MLVADVRMKSSAVSASIDTPLGLEAVAILPSGEPVLKENEEFACALGTIVIPMLSVSIKARTRARFSMSSRNGQNHT
jgi:hypothetical protein